MVAREDSEASLRGDRGLISHIRSEFGFIRGNFLILILSWIMMDFATEMPGTYYQLFVTRLGGTATTIGLIAFASMIARSMVQFPGGYLADKTGRKRLISTMTFGMAISYVFYALAPNWQTILLGAVVSSLCGIYGPALNAIISDSLPSDRRGTGFSIMHLITSVSTTPAPLLAGWLYTRIGLIPSVRLEYALVIVAFLVAGLLRTRLKETIDEPESIDRSELVMVYPRSIRAGLRVWNVLPSSAFFLFLSGIIGTFANSLFQPVILLWTVDDLGISEVQWSIILTALFVSMIVLSIPLGKLIDKVGKKKPILISYFMFGLVIIVFLQADFYRALIVMPLIGALNILLGASTSALRADLVPREHRGKVAGTTNFFNLVAGAFGQLAGGYMYDNVSHPLPFLCSVLFLIPVFLLTLLFVKEPKKEEINEA